jgi:hypothetical protein
VNPVIWGITAAAVAATVWHALSEHHAHRRLLRRFRPGTVVPETRHDTWWHSLPKSHRVAVQAALTAAGLAAGIAYETVPAVVMAVLGGHPVPVTGPSPRARAFVPPLAGSAGRLPQGAEAAFYPRRVIPVTSHARARALQYKATMTRTKACCRAALREFARTATATPSCSE